jgi:transketolase C-terminal domain/subunit
MSDQLQTWKEFSGYRALNACIQPNAEGGRLRLLDADGVKAIDRQMFIEAAGRRMIVAEDHWLGAELHTAVMEALPPTSRSPLRRCTAQSCNFEFTGARRAQTEELLAEADRVAKHIASAARALTKHRGN